MYASQPYKTPYCNRHCQPLLKCPPGSHISSTRKSCVWHGRGESDSNKSSPSLLSNIIGDRSSRFALPRSSSVYEEAQVNPARVSALSDYMRDRSGSEEFGGGGRRRRSKKRSSRRKRSGKRHSRKRASRRRRHSRKRSSGRRRHSRKSRH